MRLIVALSLATLFCSSPIAHAQQSTLARPSRTAFKCIVAGKVTYSDEPCVGAERVDLQPTRGLGKYSGKELVGADVRRARNREQIAEAIRPITSMGNAQFEVASRRANLSASAKSECISLDNRLPQMEQQERLAAAEDKQLVQRKLFGLRARFRQLGC